MKIDMKELARETKSLKVLYVEDEQIVREQTTMIFDILFDSVDVAFDGEDGWQKYQNGEYDLVFSDISMPRMDGLKLTSLIKEQNLFQMVVIISAYNTADYLLKAIELGVDGFVLKPLDLDKMLLLIKKLADAIIAMKLKQHFTEGLESDLQEKTQIILKQAVTDKLTGLQNRTVLTKYLDEYQGVRSLVLINIDNFDSINSIYGYDNGNIIIQKLATFLSQNLPKDAQLFYLGSDEFAIVLDEFDKVQLQSYAQELHDAIANMSLKINENNVNGSVTIAIAKESKNLLKDAHIALKEAKKSGKNRIKFYDSNLNIEKLQKKIYQYSQIIHSAIEQKSIVPYFQPIVDNQTKEVYKYECLARIEYEGKVYSPYHFIEVSELLGLISEITKIMIDKSFAMFRGTAYAFSINITEIDLNDNYLKAYFEQKLQEYNIKPSQVIIEVLEGVSAHGVEDSLRQLQEFKAMGFSIAIDDFGTENSNFARVHAMNVDFIKIDGSFVKNVANDEKSYSIVKSISEFSKSIGAKVIAEYVHSKEVQDIIESLDIEYSQGYYFSEPKRELYDAI